MLRLKAVSWVSPLKRRQFFEHYAASIGFDFRSPEAWYSQDQDQILATKGSVDVIVHYKGSTAKALVAVFSDIGLKEQHFNQKKWDHKKDWRAIMEDFATKNEFDYRSPSVWYSQYQKTKLDTGVKEVLRYYMGSLPNALIDLFPEIGLLESQFQRSMSWNSVHKRRQFFETYANENGFDYLSAEAWYAQPLHKILSRKGAKSIRDYHNNSIRRALVDLFPDIELDLQRFKMRSRGRAKKKKVRKPIADLLFHKRRQVFIQYALDRGFDHLIAESWYSQPIRRIFRAKGVSNVVKHYRGNIPKAINDLFPGINLDPRRFSFQSAKSKKLRLVKKRAIVQRPTTRKIIGRVKRRANAATWASPIKRRHFFEKYAKGNGFDFSSPQAWYSQTQRDILATKGACNILLYHKCSITKALMDLFPNIGLEKEGFKSKKWFSKNDRRAAFEKYAKENGFDFLSPDAWYTHTRHNIKGVSGVVSHYNNSVVNALIDLFPEIGLEKSKFKPAKFETSRKRLVTKSTSPKKWFSRKKRRIFFENYARKNKFNPLSPEAWYSQTYFNILSTQEAGEVMKYYKNNISEALIDVFPELGLEKSKFKSHLMKDSLFRLKPEVINQGYLEQVAQDLFLSEDIIKNTRKISQVTNPNTGEYFEIDVWLPSLHLGFEFQDNYHYMNTWYSKHALGTVRRLDDSKRSTARLSAITLVEVPYWWSGSPESLAATTQFERPDLLRGLTSESTLISLNPDPTVIDLEEVPDVGTLMLASFPLDPNFNQSITRRNWWMGEKYDGMRCCWNPQRRVVYSRTGKQIPVTRSFTAALPSIFVDGEFWFGRGMFSSLYSLLHGNCSWPELRMLSFDCPHPSIHSLSFEQRYKFLLHSIPNNHPINIIAQRILCEGSIHLNSLIGKVIDFGGEGMMLRRVGSQYEPGRNRHLIKLKSSYGDTEGLVVLVANGEITLKLPDGQLFKVPTRNIHIPPPPLKVGEIVTFSYEKLVRKNVPVNVSIFRRRSDLNWDDVLAKSRQVHEEFQGDNRSVAKLGGFPSEGTKGDIAPTLKDQHKKNNWISSKDRRAFFENFAQESGFDFLLPTSWYSQSVNKTTRAIIAKGALQVLKYHNESVTQAIVDLFPELGMERGKFKL